MVLVSDFNGLQRAPDKVLLFARQHAEFLLDHPLVMRETQTRLFEKMVDYLTNLGVKVILFLPPLHPETYHPIAEKSDQIELIQDYLKTLAIAKDLSIVGGYNPEPFDLDNEHFFDALHMRREGVTDVYKMHKALFSK